MDEGTAAIGLEEAAAVLGAGGVVAIPTDTVYGLAADPSQPGSTDRLFAMKERPLSVDLPVLVSDLEQADGLAGPDGLTPVARRLVQRFWPGALTVVVPRRTDITWLLGGDGITVGLRCPDHDRARALCGAVGPLAVTSANHHGAPPLTTAAAVRDVFGPNLPVVDGGRCDGAPSTVAGIGPEGVRCLRAGAIGWDEVVAASR